MISITSICKKDSHSIIMKRLFKTLIYKNYFFYPILIKEIEFNLNFTFLDNIIKI